MQQNNRFTPRQQAALRAASPAQRILLRQRFTGQIRSRQQLASFPTRRTNQNLSPGVIRSLNTVPRLLATGAITAQFTHVTTMLAPTFTGNGNLTAPTHTTHMAMRPSRHGLSAYCNLYMQYRLQRLEYRFVGILPDNTTAHIFTGFSPTNASFANNGAHVSSLSGFWSGRCNVASPWKLVVAPNNTVAHYLNNDYNTQAATNSNAQGWLHASMAGATHQQPVGYYELRGTYEFHGPCTRTSQE